MKKKIQQYLGVQEVAKENVDKYGIVDGVQISDRVYKVDNLIEKPRVDLAPSNLAILGRYIITPEIFDILDRYSTWKRGRNSIN